ncbi:hypothetical protein [Pedobacter immunditicola]|uniref:hypothetical protein n=1 Tax=Pedobacter immunditicola TaxID=3133440 RepID=UPI0030A472C6
MKVNIHIADHQLLLLFIIIIFPCAAMAQKDSLGKQPFLYSLFENLELKQSFGSAATRKEPVRLQFTLPENHEDSYLIDGAIGLSFFDVPLTEALDMTGKFIGEYHRNTMITEEQFTWQAGFSTSIRTRIFSNKANTTFTQLIFTPTLKYSRNVMDTLNSFVLMMDAIPFRSSATGINLNTYTIRGNRKLINLLSIVPAFELQHNYSAQEEADNGTIFRPMVKFQYSIGGNKYRFPVTRMVEPIKTWEASVDYVLRYAIINSTVNREKYTNLLTTGIDYYFLTLPVSVAFGISYNSGSDPLQGLKKQQYWLATLSIQK